MADKSFGVKELNLLNASGTPTITSPNNLNLNANTVAISTSVTIGQNLTVSANAGIASLNVTGIATVNNFIVAGVTTFSANVNISGSNRLELGTDFDLYRSSGNTLISNQTGDLTIDNNASGGDVKIYSNTDFEVFTSDTKDAIKAVKDDAIKLFFNGNQKLETTTNGIDVTGAISVNGSATSAWTISNNSSSNYVISGPGGLSSANNPDLYLERGQTYQFIMNAAGHGFGIQTSSGTWNSSNAYTTGITNAGAATGVINFQVPYSAPDRLYYACTSQHSGMVGNIYIQGGPSDIKMCDQWRRAAVLNTNNAENFITTDWERVDGSGQGTYTVNGGMSQSGGIFTFPRTGIYLVTWQAYAECTTTSRQNAVNIYITTNNSSYSNRASSVFSIGPDLGSYNYGAGHCSSLVDVTDTSQVKVKFRVFSSGNVAWDQSSAENRNVATFLRIGDT